MFRFEIFFLGKPTAKGGGEGSLSDYIKLLFYGFYHSSKVRLSKARVAD